MLYIQKGEFTGAACNVIYFFICWSFGSITYFFSLAVYVDRQIHLCGCLCLNLFPTGLNFFIIRRSKSHIVRNYRLCFVYGLWIKKKKN